MIALLAILISTKGGMPRYRQTTPKTIQEMQTYSWDAKAAQRGEEKPLKLNDHGPDAFRYFAKSEVPYWRLSC